jgi:hypothetical protein
MEEYVRLQSEIKSLEAENARLRAKVEKLKAEKSEQARLAESNSSSAWMMAALIALVSCVLPTLIQYVSRFHFGSATQHPSFESYMQQHPVDVSTFTLPPPPRIPPNL